MHSYHGHCLCRESICSGMGLVFDTWYDNDASSVSGSTQLLCFCMSKEPWGWAIIGYMTWGESSIMMSPKSYSRCILALELGLLVQCCHGNQSSHYSRTWPHSTSHVTPRTSGRQRSTWPGSLGRCQGETTTILVHMYDMNRHIKLAEETEIIRPYFPQNDKPMFHVQSAWSDGL